MPFPSLTPQRGWFWPSLYIRPKYFFVITPFGTQHIGYPPIFFIPAFVVTFVALMVTTGYFCCRRKKQTRQVLLVTSPLENVDHLLGMRMLSSLAQKNKISLIGIVINDGGSPKAGPNIIIEWIKSFQLFARTRHGPPSVVHGTAGKDMILSAAKRHGRNLTILVSGAATAMGEAVNDDEKHVLRKVGAVVVQGFCKMKTKEGRRNKCCCRQYNKIVLPDFKRSNSLRGDKVSADCMFRRLQNYVQFSILDQDVNNDATHPLKSKDYRSVVSLLLHLYTPGREALGKIACTDSTEMEVIAEKLNLEGIHFHFVLLVWYLQLMEEEETFPPSIVRWGRHQILDLETNENCGGLANHITSKIFRLIKSGDQT